MRVTSAIGRGAHSDASFIRRNIYQTYLKAFKFAYRISTNYPRTNIYEHDWDILFVLDACRADLMREVADEYGFVGDFDTINSVGSSSGEWLDKTFTEEYVDEIRNTAYVTGNIKTHDRLDADEFAVLDEVWKYAWDNEHGTVLPQPLTDRAISTWREDEPDRLIVHYMQPHFPSIPHPELGARQVRDYSGGGWKTVSIWDDVRAGEYDLDTVWKAYLDNLRTVLDNIKTFLKLISADTVILTSDHGNAIGEWGFYDHPGYHPLRTLREVPWIETSAEKTEAYEPLTYGAADSVPHDEVRSRLESLGYVQE